MALYLFWQYSVDIFISQTLAQRSTNISLRRCFASSTRNAEDTHHAGTEILKELWAFGLYPRERGQADQDGMISVDVFGQTLANPVGISGGLDKNAEISDPLLALGPGIVEIGGVTPLPQDGNPRPRVFRIDSQNAVINRYGLNSEGADVVAMRLRQRVRDYAYQHGFGINEEAERAVLDGAAGVPPGSLVPGRLLAVQIAKNRITPDSDIEAVVRDHVYCVKQIGKYADIIVVNVSSPNTPGLRSLQSQEPLTRILSSVVDAANAVSRRSKPKVMVKVSPDESSNAEIQGICDAVWEAGVDGVIVGNTTNRRPDPWPQGYLLTQKEAKSMLEQGGYSGPQLFPNTLNLVKKYRRTLDDGPKESEESLEVSSESSKGISAPSEPSGFSKKSTVLVDQRSPTDLAGPSSVDGVESGISENIQAGKERDEGRLKPPSSGTGQSETEKQPLIRLPERHSSDTATDSVDAAQNQPLSTSPKKQPATSATTRSKRRVFDSSPKVIFASGGITNGEQALQVLNAGASVAMIYTAMTYDGVGTVGRIKREMRDEIRRQSLDKPANSM